MERYKHRYPYDWRTKKPVIFRATEQVLHIPNFMLHFPPFMPLSGSILADSPHIYPFLQWFCRLDTLVTHL
jgi:hypothetical protein